MAGENERNQGVYTLKNMQTGEQQALHVEEILDTIH
jgi:histidyl-tRNA synthetase